MFYKPFGKINLLPLQMYNSFEMYEIQVFIMGYALLIHYIGVLTEVLNVQAEVTL